MSFEGYYQVLCANGHLSMFDCYAAHGNEDELQTCQHCNAVIIQRNLVDDTNGEAVGKINYQLIEEIKCKCCGHIKERIYKKP